MRHSGRVNPGALILASGPLDPADWWVAVKPALSESGVVTVAPVDACEAPPFSVAWIASIAQNLRLPSVDGPIVVVGHGTAGPLLPALARAQRVAGRHIGGYVFVDATLPRPGPSSHLDLLRAAAPDEAERAHEHLHEPGGLWPAGYDDERAGPEPMDPARPGSGQRPRDHQFWTETLPPAIDWPDAPCAYVLTGQPAVGTGDTGFWARSARARGWAVTETADPADGVLGAVEQLPG